MAFKEIKIPVIRTDDKEVNRALDALRKALEEVYKELKRLEKDKQDA